MKGASCPGNELTWDYWHADWPKIKEFLSGTNWKAIIPKQDPEQGLRNLLQRINDALERFVPRKRIKLGRSKPWYTLELNELRKRKEAAHTRWKLNRQDEDLKEDYTEIRNQYNHTLRRTKQTHASTVAEKIDGLQGRPWWKEVDRALGRSSKHAIPPLNDGLVKIHETRDKTEVLNRLFANKARVSEPDAEFPNVTQKTDSRLSNIRFHSRIVKKLLLNIDTSKACGLDDISGILLKECAKELAAPLARLYQSSMDCGIFPGAWKVAKVVPVYKKGNRTQPSNYRPVALLSLLSKIMEKIVNHAIVSHVQRYGLLSDNQFGFRQGHSTLHPLMIIHQFIADKLDKGGEAMAVALDISGAFDTVWHRRLLSKCRALGLSGKLISWLTSYLLNRTQVVGINGIFSGPVELGAGVPQGSILGPTLFQIYIDDLCEEMSSQPLLFADDCTLVIGIAGKNQRINARAVLQRDLDSCCKWAEVNQMTFAAHKTQVITFSRKKDAHSQTVVPLRMLGTELEEVRSIKLLGVTFDDQGSNKDHIKERVANTAKLLGLLRRQSPFLSESARYHVWIACMRPVMEYCSPIFAGAPAGLLDSMERLQRRAARLFPSKAHLLDPISIRREVAGLSQLHRIVHGTAPSMVRNLIKPVPFTNLRTTRGSESGMGILNVPASRTTAHRQSFLPYFVRSWNKLPDDAII